jgi:heme-degrading monooxygenase HmoA
MIARIWRGWTRPEDAEPYARYAAETGLRAYRTTPGNRGAWLLHRAEGDRAEILTISFWESLAAVATFAGDDVEAAVFYPDDDRWLVDRETRVTHYIVETDGAEGLDPGLP